MNWSGEVEGISFEVSEPKAGELTIRVGNQMAQYSCFHPTEFGLDMEDSEAMNAICEWLLLHEKAARGLGAPPQPLGAPEHWWGPRVYNLTTVYP